MEMGVLYVNVLSLYDALGIGFSKALSDECLLIVPWLSCRIDTPEASLERVFDKVFGAVLLPRGTVDEGRFRVRQP